MIRYFSNTTPGNYLALLLVFLVTQVYGWIHPADLAVPDLRHGWLAHTFFSWLYGLPVSAHLWQVMGSLIMLGLALYSNLEFNRYRFTSTQNLYPALIVVTLSGIDPSYTMLSPILLSTLCLMAALSTLLRLYQENTPRIWLWDTGGWFMLAILLFPSLLLATPWLLITIAILRPTRSGELLALLLGLLTPLFLLSTYLYATDNLWDLYPSLRGIAIPTRWVWQISMPTTILLGCLVLIFMAALLITIGRLNTYGIQVRQYIRVIGLSIPFLLAAGLYQGTPLLTWFLPLLLPLAFILGFQYAEFSRQKIVSWLHLVLLALVLLQQYVTFATV